MITTISPTQKIRKAVQSYLQGLVVKIPMTIEIRKGVGSRKTSHTLTKKNEPNHYLFSDGAFGGVVLNTAMIMQGLEYLPPAHDWLHACDVRLPERIPDLEALYGSRRKRRSLRSKNPRPDRNPRSQE